MLNNSHPSYRRRGTAGALIATVCLALLSVAPAANSAPAPSVYVGFDLGAHLVISDWDLMGADAPVLNGLGHGGAFTFRVGGVVHWALSIEGFATLVTAESDLGGANHILRYGAAGLIHPFKGWDWAPHLSVGGGGYTHLSGDVGPDSDFQVFAGLGLRGMINDHVGLRVDLQWHFTDAFGGVGNNALITVGIDAFLWRPKPDSDGDGVSDTEDRCPNIAGEGWAQGCPDSDGDGVADSDDKCPKKSGPKANGGCPAPADSDGDGVPDDTDECPMVKGLATLGGCPDRDSDGVRDGKDLCPDVAGTTKAFGCPDKDGDGVGDATDKCPDQAGVPEKKGCPASADVDRDGVPDSKDMCPAVAGSPGAKGCPDRDRDTVADEDDKCPDTAGLPEERGCVPKALRQFTGSIRGIYFESGKAKIRSKSFKILDQAATVLNKYPKLNILVQGHTDDRGSDTDNQKLSEKRAQAVMAYLVSKSVSAKRLTAKGYGESKPVASNKTTKGRGKNRRIEFQIAP